MDTWEKVTKQKANLPRVVARTQTAYPLLLFLRDAHLVCEGLCLERAIVWAFWIFPRSCFYSCSKDVTSAVRKETSSQCALYTGSTRSLVSHVAKSPASVSIPNAFLHVFMKPSSVQSSATIRLMLVTSWTRQALIICGFTLAETSNPSRDGSKLGAFTISSAVKLMKDITTKSKECGKRRSEREGRLQRCWARASRVRQWDRTDHPSICSGHLSSLTMCLNALEIFKSHLPRTARLDPLLWISWNMWNPSRCS